MQCPFILGDSSVAVCLSQQKTICSHMQKDQNRPRTGFPRQQLQRGRLFHYSCFYSNSRQSWDGFIYRDSASLNTPRSFRKFRATKGVQTLSVGLKAWEQICDFAFRNVSMVKLFIHSVTAHQIENSHRTGRTLFLLPSQIVAFMTYAVLVCY